MKIKHSNTKKKRVRIKEWQREFQQVKRNTGDYAEDGFGVALLNCNLKYVCRVPFARWQGWIFKHLLGEIQISDDRVACYSEEYKDTYKGLRCEGQVKRSGTTEYSVFYNLFCRRRFFIPASNEENRHACMDI